MDRKKKQEMGERKLMDYLLRVYYFHREWVASKLANVLQANPNSYYTQYYGSEFKEQYIKLIKRKGHTRTRNFFRVKFFNARKKDVEKAIKTIGYPGARYEIYKGDLLTQESDYYGMRKEDFNEVIPALNRFCWLACVTENAHVAVSTGCNPPYGLKKHVAGRGYKVGAFNHILHNISFIPIWEESWLYLRRAWFYFKLSIKLKLGK